MSGGTASASRRDRAFVLPEDPQHRRLTEWMDRGTRRPTEREDKRARRLALFAARMSAIMAEMASGVSEAIAEALQATRAEHLEEVDLAPMTTTTSVISKSSTSIQRSGGSSSIFTAGGGAAASHDFNLPSAVPITCSTDCPRRGNGSSDATTTTLASAAGAVSTTCVLPESTAAASVSFASTPCESPDVQAVCVIDKQPWTAEQEAAIPAVCAKTALHEGDDDLILAVPSKRNSAAIAPLDSTSIPTVSSYLVPVTELVMLTRCSMEYLGDDTTVDTPTFAPCSSILKRLGGTTPPAGTVFGCDDAELVIAAQLPDDSLKHFSVSWFFSVPVRGTTATAAGIQVTSLFLSAEDVPTIVSPIAVSTVLFLLLYDVRPLPWPSFLDSHHVGYEIPLMPCPWLTCLLRDECGKHPWPAPQMFSLMMGRYCSDQISMEEPLSCLQCVRLQFCCLPGRANLSGKLFLFTENDEVDKKSLGYSIRCGSEAIQWEIAWKLRYEGDSLVQTYRFQICILALDEQLYNFSELSCCCEPWLSWQLQFFISAPKIVSSIYDLLISLKTRYELDMRPNLSLQPDILALGCFRIVLQTMSICSALQTTEFPCFLASCIQPGAPMFLGSDCYLLIALIYMQQWPVWVACFSSPSLQYYTEFGSTIGANQQKYRTADYNWHYWQCFRIPSFQFGITGNVSIYCSSHFQWYIAWSDTPAGYHSSNGFLAILNREAVVHQSYTTTRVLTVDVRTRWIYHHILRGNHYSKQMQRLFNDSLLQSQCWFCTPGHILFFCYALEQSGNSWRICLVPLKSWFQCNRAGRESLYSSANFQWTIAWLLVWSFSWPFFLSVSWLLPCSLCKDRLLPCSTQRVFLSSFGNCQLKIAGSFGLALTEWNPWTSGVYFWSSYLGASAYGSYVPFLSWLQFALQNTLASPEDFHFSPIGKLYDISVESGIYTRSMHYLERQGNPEGLNDAWSNTPNAPFQMPWDPGGLSQDRLGGKPNFMEGGLSATLLINDLLLGLGCYWTGTIGPRPIPKLLQIQYEVDLEKEARNRTEGRLRPRLG